MHRKYQQPLDGMLIVLLLGIAYYGIVRLGELSIENLKYLTIDQLLCISKRKIHVASTKQHHTIFQVGLKRICGCQGSNLGFVNSFQSDDVLPKESRPLCS